MKQLLTTLSLLLLLAVATASADSEFLDEFKDIYGELDFDLLKTNAAVIDVKDFVYKKDVAEFTFDEGTFYLMRQFGDRYSTAYFEGKGHAKIMVPPKAERIDLAAISPDSLVDQEFKTCLIRMADNLDVDLLGKYDHEIKTLPWKTYNRIKQTQLEFFFKPLVYHRYDFYFQLLRSLYERADDGYFWTKFDRYTFNFDPNRPEQVIIGYEYEGGDQTATEGAVFQRQEYNKYDNAELSDIKYETTILEKSGTLEMAGLDAGTVLGAAIDLKLLVNPDSLRFVTLFLDRKFKLDSIQVNGKDLDFHRRHDFSFTGLILPEYYHAGDTLDITIFYRGKDYTELFPYVDNPAASSYAFDFIQPNNYNYFMPGMGSPEEIEDGRVMIKVMPNNKFRTFELRGFPTGLDTLPVVSEIGLTLNFLKWDLMQKKYSDCFIPDDIFETTMTEAFNYMAGDFGAPPGTFEVAVSPAGYRTMPGLMEAPQIACVTSGPMEAFGGFRTLAGLAAGEQWFGSLLQPATDREVWLVDALPEYASMLYIEKEMGGTYYTNLFGRRDSVDVARSINKDRPMAAGSRVSKTVRANKGVWIFHMLRYLMHDLETHSDASFMKFMQELMLYYNARPFTNADFIARAEKYVGRPLKEWFDYWLYGKGYPKLKGEYKFVEEGGQKYAQLDVVAEDLNDVFKVPVIIRVAGTDGKSMFFREEFGNGENSIKIGPFTSEPSELYMNEFFSVYADVDVKKKN